MMHKNLYYEDDLFKSSTMTFGEHLDDLRRCLIWALLGLTVGVLGAMLFGREAVRVISAPMESALRQYYKDKRLAAYKLDLTRWEAEGVKPPAPLEKVEKNLNLGLLFDPVEYDTVDETLPNDPETIVGTKLVPRPLRWHRAVDDPSTSMRTLNATEGFTIWMKASFVLGLIVSSPWVFYHLWAFVASGLYPHERRYVYVFLPFSLGLFLSGAALAYLFVFKPVLDFLLGFNSWMGIDPDPRINEWIGFVLMLPLGFGVSFQLPLVMLFLDRFGIISWKLMAQQWRISILAIVVISAVLTPADPYSMFLMAIPLVVLFFGGLLLCKFMPRGPVAEAVAGVVGTGEK